MSGKNSLGNDLLQIAWDWLAVMYMHANDGRLRRVKV